MKNFISNVLQNMPADWLNLTTHRLDIYNESLAKTEFLDRFEEFYKNDNFEASLLAELPTAFDYIRLGHPLSCVLEWTIAKLNHLNTERKYLMANKIYKCISQMLILLCELGHKTSSKLL